MSRADDDGSSRYVSTGPFVWLATLAITTVLLVLLKQALWLVVPFLVAVVVYYALFPPVHRLILAGVSRETAASVVAGAFLLVAKIQQPEMDLGLGLQRQDQELESSRWQRIFILAHLLLF